MSEAEHPSGHDPSSVPNEFARRLERAIAERGLSLHRIRAHLREAGLDVSIATLSYWTSGRSRPTRGRSLAVVRALEKLLDVAPNFLLGSIPAERTYHETGSMMPAERLHEVLVELGLERPPLRHRLLMHDATHVGPDRTEQWATSRQVIRAEEEGIDRWAIVLQHEAGQYAELEAVSGLRIGEVVRIEEANMLVGQALLPRPLHRGELVLTEHRTHYRTSVAQLDWFGRALNQIADLLVLEAFFEGDDPRTVERTWLDPATQRTQHLDPAVPVDDHHAHAVVHAAVAGTHALAWQW